MWFVMVSTYKFDLFTFSKIIDNVAGEREIVRDIYPNVYLRK